MTDAEFFTFASQIKNKRVERDQHGNIIINPPVGMQTGEFELNAAFYLKKWSLETGGGHVYGSNTGFILPNGAVRSPDAAWISTERYNLLPEIERKRFGHICPDFIIEIRSPSDNVEDVMDKMQEYMQNGAKLGYLIDPEKQLAFIYKPGDPVVEITDFSISLSDEELIPGFKLSLSVFR